MGKHIHDPDLNENHVPDEDQCRLCVEEAEIDGLCRAHFDDGEEKEILWSQKPK